MNHATRAGTMRRPGDHEHWSVKFRRFWMEMMQDAVDHPKLVKPRRASGPRVLPANWHEIEGQATLPKQPEPPKAA